MSGFLATQSSASQTEAIYIAYFGRAADGPGYLYWTGSFGSQEASGVPATTAAVNIANSFAVQSEATALYPFLAAPPAMLSTTDPVQIAGVDQFLGQVYENLFNRAADTTGEAYWQQAILSGAVSIGSAVYAIANGAQNTSTNDDQTVLAAKIAAASTFTINTYAAGLGITAPLAPSFMTAAKSAVAQVTDATSEAASQAATSAYIVSALAATYTLAEALAATSLPDTYNLSNASASLGSNLTVAAATAAQAHAQTIVSGALNASSLPQMAVAYTLSDTLANLSANSAVVSGATSYALTNGSFNLGTGLTVAAASTALAQVQALFNGATNHTSLVLTPTYTLADTLANLSTTTMVVSGATSYALTNAAGDLGLLSAAQASLVAGATDASKYTFQIQGNTFTLTTTINVIPGLVGSDGTTSTVGNDTIIGTVNASGTSTLNAGNSLNGGAGSNLLKIVDTAGFDTNDLAGVTLTNIQTVEIQNAGIGNTVAADFTADPGVSTVIAYDTATNGIDNLTGLAAGTQIVASGSGTGGSSTVNFAYAASTGAVSVSVDGGVNGVTFNNGPSSAPTSAMIASTGAANGTSTGPDWFNLAAGATLTALTVNATSNLVADLNTSNYAATAVLTVTGAATSVNLGITDFKAINAAGLTSGGLVITAGGNLTSFTGGGGNNVLDLTAGVIGGAGLTLNGGSGPNNILGIADTSLATADYTAINAATKFQTLAFNGASGAAVDQADITNSAISTLQFNTGTAGAVSLTNAVTAEHYSIISASDVDLAGGIGQTTLNVSFDGTSTDAATAGTGVTLATATTLNLTSNGSLASGVFANDSNQAGEVTLQDNSAINITGSQALELAVFDSGTGTLVGETINAGSFKGALDITCSGGVAQITFGSGVSEADFTTGNQSGVINGTTIGGLDTIAGFLAGAGGDALYAVGGTNTYAALTSAQQATITADTTLTAAINDATNAHDAAGWTAFAYGGSTYALNNAVAETAGYGTGDNVVDLGSTVSVGVLTQANFASFA